MADIQAGRLVVALVADTRQFTKALSKATATATSWAAQIGRGAASVTKRLGAVAHKALEAGKAIAHVGKRVVGIGFKALAGGALAATGAVAGLAAAMGKLALNAAPLPGIGMAFETMAGRVGLSLDALRAAAAGTVSDFELMRKANVALTGAGDQLGSALGQDLPKLLEIARAAARATGQDVDYLFSSLVTGVKRSSPLLIDNTGLVLKLGEANEAMAAELGKTVQELTAEERQIALLRATLKAGEKMVGEFGGGQATAAEKIAQFRTQIQNAKDQIGIALLPALQAVLTPLADIATKAGPKLIEWAQAAGKWLGRNLPFALRAVSELLEGDFNAALGLVRTVVFRTFGPEGQAVFDKFAEALQLFIGNVEAGGSPIYELGNALRKLGLGEFADKAYSAYEAVRDVVASVVDVVAGQAVPAFRAAFASLTEALAVLGLDWADVWNAIKTAVGVVVVGIIGVVTGLVTAVASTVEHVAGVLASMAETFRLALESIAQLVGGVMAVVRGIFTGDTELIRAGWEAWVEGLTGLATAFLEGLVNAFDGTFGTIISLVQGFVDGVAGFFKGLYDRLVGGSIVTDLMEKMKGVFSGGIEKLSGIFKGISEIVAFLSDPFGHLVQLLNEQFIPIVTNLAETVFAELSEITNQVIEDFEKLIDRFDEANEIAEDFSRTVMQLAKVLRSKLAKAVSEALPALDELYYGFRRVDRAVEALIHQVYQLAAALAELYIPPVLRGRSPSPFERSLRGIADAMREVNSLSVGMVPVGVAAEPVAGGLPAAAGGVTTDNRSWGGDTYNITVNDRSAAAMLMAMIEEHRRRRLNVFTGAR